MKRIEQEMKTQFTNDKHRLLANVVFTGHWIKSRSQAFLAPFGVSNPQFNILRILRGAKDWLNMFEVRERMVEKSPNTTRLCDKLVRKELIHRRRCDDDRRVVFLKISDQGLQLLAEVDALEKEWKFAFVEQISDEEARLACDILDRLRNGEDEKTC